ncbi:serine hydroxymethyltransferase [Bosea sp. Leaf344]|uniref:serine hydroxymethyltransferase n=1 Tax=Bosea sp. Leaf344 TaxID=1736346 RepID=UPI0006FD579E|nr:beta-eliminating lyase-related protein [Bosea sp. Leaf344]KQU52055.1 serine hydroxymethyltransferase [Bosea sp. Leaf344]
MTALGRRDWVPQASEDYVLGIAAETASQSLDAIEQRIAALAVENRRIHEEECVNLNPATNVMNPRAERLLAAGIGARPSLGYPGDKYEMGLEAIETIEIIAAELAAEVFGARFAEIRVPSGAIANLYAFMVAAKPGDCIIAPPGEIGGHVTHHGAGAAGLYGIVSHPAPVDPLRYTVDIDRLRQDALRLRPKLISIGGSLNLFPHPIREIRAIADEIGALVLFDAAHMSGMIAGQAWQQPLAEGAHLMTMSTYKSLGGPPSGLILTDEPEIARKLDAIAYPGLTANFDAAKSASLAISLLDWKAHGEAYAREMALTAKALGEALVARQAPVFARDRGITTSHQFAIEAASYGGGQAAAKKLRAVNILSCGIGLPLAAVPEDVNGLRLGTPEIVRFGMKTEHMPELAGYIMEGLEGSRPAAMVAKDVTAFRSRFRELHFMR